MTKSTMAGGRVDSDRSTTATWSTPRKVAFYSVIALMLVGSNVAFWRVHLFPVLAWFPDDFLNRFYKPQLDLDGITVGDFAQHRIHYLAISANHWGAVLIPLLLLLRNPITNVAPMWQVTGGMVVVTLTYPFGDVSPIPPPVFAVIALAVVAGLLHPANIFRTVPRLGDMRTAAIGAVAAIPLIMLVVDNVQLQASAVSADPHGQGLHYQWMAEYGLVLLLLLALGASSLPGRRYSVWCASFMIGLVGAGFLAFPDHPSSEGAVWGIVMIAFAIVYTLMGEERHRKRSPALVSPT
ncbi:MAG: hypothetical protein ACRD1T_11215 [Acidimicrobiia bacterium]